MNFPLHSCVRTFRRATLMSCTPFFVSAEFPCHLACLRLLNFIDVVFQIHDFEVAAGEVFVVLYVECQGGVLNTP